MVPLLLVTLVPLLVLYGGILVFEEHPVGLPPGQLGRAAAHRRRRVSCWPSTTALVGLAVASLTGRRAFAVGGYLLILVAPTVLAGLLSEAFPDARRAST